MRDAKWDEAANIRIEIICTLALADAVLTRLQDRYYENFAMVACLQEVDVLRPEKF